MFPHKSIVKVMIAVLLSVVSVSLVSLFVSSNVIAMFPESVTVATAGRSSYAAQSTNLVTDTTVADFQSGSGSCFVAPSTWDGNVDGEVILSPTLMATFSGTSVTPDWYIGSYDTINFPVVSNDFITVEKAFAGVNTAFSEGHSLEFEANFTGPKQWIGFASDTNLTSIPWALFGTFDSSTDLVANTSSGAGVFNTPVITGGLGVPHRYQISWTTGVITYSMDGAVVATHNIDVGVQLHPLIADNLVDNLRLSADWLRMSPYATTTCSFQSRVLDAGQSAHWLDANLVSQQPAGTIVDGFQTRSGRVITPDGTWSAWSPLSGTTILNPNGQYIQYQVQLTTTNLMFAPALDSVAFSFTPAGQTITFDPLPNRTYGDPPFTVIATATSGLPVTFTVSGTCGISVATVTLTGAGSCAVGAHQAGDTTFDPAPDVTQTFTITKATPVLTWTNPANIVFGTPLGATQLNASASVPGSFVYTPASGTVLSAGANQPLRADFTPTDSTNYFTATKSVAITVTKASQTITFDPLPDKRIGDPPFTVSATASSGLPVTFMASGDCSVSGTVVTLTRAGTCTVTAQQAGTSNYNPAPDVPQAFNIARAYLYLPLIMSHFP